MSVIDGVHFLKMTDSKHLLSMDTQTIDLTVVVDRGILHCREGDWETGLALLRKAARKDQKGARFPSVYYSYLGYAAARLEGERRDGLALCKHALRVGKYESENYLNLARLYLLVGDRRHAVTAVRRGLKIDSSNRALLALRSEMGSRRKPVIRFLSRDSAINQWLGRRRHERETDERAKNTKRA